MKVDTSNFDLRNIAVNKSGELAVREGLNKYATIQSSNKVGISDGFQCLAAFTVKSQFVDDIRLYAIGRSWSDDDLYLQVLDETLEFRNRRQVMRLGKYREIRDVTHAVINGQLIISGPDIPTLWGYTGSGLILAEKQPSVNVSVETLDVPNGICVSWAGRCVIAKQEALFVSDPLAPRTYTAGGIVTMPGVVYGLHVGLNGDLIAVTADGVYSLSSQAASQGQNIVGSIQKLSSYRASSYKSSCLTPRGVYGLTERGISRIDIEQSDDMFLSDKTYVRSLTQMIDFPDYRVGRIFQTSRGVCVSMGAIDEDGDGDFSSALCMIDFLSGLQSWWTTKGIWRLVEPILSREGDDFFVMQQEDLGGSLRSRTGIFAFNRIGGNWQDVNTGANGDRLKAFVSGVVASDLETSPVVRYVYASSDAGGSTMRCAVRGEKYKRNGSLQEYPVQANGVVIGTDFWQQNSATTPFTSTTPRYRTCELKRIRFDFAKKTNDISLEIGIEGSGSRFRVLNMTVAGYGVNTA